MILERQKTNAVSPEPEIAPVDSLDGIFRPHHRKGNIGQPGELFELKVWGNETLGQNSREEGAAQKEKTLIQKPCTDLQKVQ